MSIVINLADDNERAHGSGVIQSVVTVTQIIKALTAATQPIRPIELAVHYLRKAWNLQPSGNFL